MEYKRPYVKESTFASYTLSIRNSILPVFGECDDLTEDIVQKYILDCTTKGFAKHTIQDRLVVLKMIMKFASGKGWMSYHDWKAVFPTSTKGKIEINILTPKEHKKILDYIKENFTFYSLGIYISLTTGLRIGEVCGLKWEDIDCDRGVLSVRRTVERVYVLDGEEHFTKIILGEPKTINSRRDVPICKELMSMVKPLKKVVNENFYVLTNAEKPTEPRTYRTFFHRLMEKLYMPRIRYHDLRHTFATRCIENKCDYKTVSVLLGHADITTTLNMYVHPDETQKRNVVNKVFRMLDR